jgi:3-dehydroquinate synthase
MYLQKAINNQWPLTRPFLLSFDHGNFQSFSGFRMLASANRPSSILLVDSALRYPICVGPAATAQIVASAALHEASSTVCIVDRTVEKLHGDRLNWLMTEQGTPFIKIVLDGGEASKTHASLDRIYAEMLAARCDRRAIVLAFGGGVIGDIAGFAAATYMRGIDFIQIPTTLLAQVDSSVGGKTGINHPLGKNMIGAFHQPRAVYADVSLLRTLPPRELSAGIAEVIKHGLLADADLVVWLEQNMTQLLAFDEAALTHVVKRSVEIKAKIVSEDEHEQGVRALLNLGHTFGHALEAVLGFGTWLHGEAVGCGLVLAARMSHELGMLQSADVDRIERLVASAGLPVRVPPEAATPALLQAMLRDKKNEGGAVRFILLERIGKAVIQKAPLELAGRVIDATRSA